MKWSRSTIITLGGLALIGVMAGLLGVPSASSQALTVRAVRAPESPGMDPNWALWAKLPETEIPITAQNVAYPNGGGSVRSVKLAAVHYDGTLYVRARWRDVSRDAAAADPAEFSDAVALMFPAESAVAVPSFCMGQAGSGVNIWQWRADSQEGGPLQVMADTRPNQYTDGYFPGLEDDPTFFPARALGNPVTKLGDSPVQNLIAQAFGTLALATDQSVLGNGVWQDNEWSVVFARDFTGGDPSQASFTDTLSTNMAVAVWNGTQGDRGGKKTVSQFVTLSMSNQAYQAPEARDWSDMGMELLFGGGVILAGVALVAFMILTGGSRRRAQ